MQDDNNLGTGDRSLLRGLQARLESCSGDELRVVDRFLARLEKGRRDYGPLDLASNHRSLDDWRNDLAEEREDCLVYQAIIDVAEHARRVDAIATLEDDEIDLADGDQPPPDISMSRGRR
jgi:hypothetical protein